jgi:hypothetical protein
MNPDQARRYWGVAILASLALHGGAVGAAAMLFDTYRPATAHTEIIFSEAPPLAAVPVARTAEHAPVPKHSSETAERVAPTESARLSPQESATAAAVQRLAPSTAVSAMSPTAAAAITPKSAVEMLAQAPANLATQADSAARVSSSSPARAKQAAADTAASASIIEKAAPAVQVAIAPSAAGFVATDNAVQTAQVSSRPTIAPLAGTSAETVSPVAKSAVSIARPAISAPASASSGVAASQRLSQAPRAEPETAAPAQIARPLRSTSERLSPAIPPQRLEIARPLEPPQQTALLVPVQPRPSEEEATKLPDPYREAVEFIRRFDAGSCFVAFPAAGFGGVEFRTFGANRAGETALVSAYANALDAKISSGDLAEAQCEALSFVRNAKRYPAFTLVLDLDAPEVASGTALSGSIFEAREKFVHLLLVDDEGRVQVADEFVSVAGRAERRFRLPVFLTSGPVQTQQLLMAIASDRAVPMLLDGADQPAAEFFSRLAREVAAGAAELDIAVEGFSVR